VREADEVAGEDVKKNGYNKVYMQKLISESVAKKFIMRRFTVGPGGSSPLHHHDYEHEVYVLEGEGVVTDGETARPLRPGSTVFVPPNETHQFKNTGKDNLVFLCMIPV